MGVLQGLVFAAVLAVLFPLLMYGYTRLKPRPTARDFDGEALEFQTDLQRRDVLEALTNGWALRQAALVDVDTTNGSVLAQDGLRFTSFGYYYLIRVEAMPDRRSSVTVRIRSKIVERGPLRRREREAQHRRILHGVSFAIETFRLSRLADADAPDSAQ